MTSGSDAVDRPMSVDVDVDGGRTTITVSGDSDVAVVVRSASGERIYLPPGDGGDAGDPDPYGPADDESPYEGITDESPYDGPRGADARPGRTRTADGFRILHPEPVTDFRFVRSGA